MRIGIDLGGTKTEIVALDDKGRRQFQQRIPTPRQSYSSIVNSITQLIHLAEGELQRQCSLGLCIPGAIDRRRQVVKNANTTVLNGRPLAKDLGEALQRPVRIANDANCLALSEAVDGAAAGATIVFGVIVGTGCGGGLVVNGQVIEGANGLTGEWGHNRLNDLCADEQTGHTCYCGKTGCVETWISGTALARHYREAALERGGLEGKIHSEVSAGENVSGHDKRLSAEQIVALAQQGDALAERQVALLEHRMARALAQIINIVDPHVIVLGGGLSNIDRLYHNVPALWQEWVFSEYAVDTRLVKAQYGDASGVRGAAWLWP